MAGSPSKPLPVPVPSPKKGVLIDDIIAALVLLKSIIFAYIHKALSLRTVEKVVSYDYI